MFFTNIAPQHKDLNQKLWLDLEDHILDNTDDENARVSVFVGCVFDEDDPPHKATKIKVPMGFWKIVASSSKPIQGQEEPSATTAGPGIHSVPEKAGQEP